VWWIDVDQAPKDKSVDVAALQAAIGGGDTLSVSVCPALLPKNSDSPASASSVAAPGERGSVSQPPRTP